MLEQRRAAADERQLLLTAKRVAETQGRLKKLAARADDAAVAARLDAEAAAERERFAAKMLRESKIPPIYAFADLEDARALPPAVRHRYLQVAGRLLRIVDDLPPDPRPPGPGRVPTPPGPVVALMGPGGEGKSHMLCAAVRRLCLRGQFARYVHLRTLMDEIDDASRFVSRSRRTVRDVHEQYVRPRVVAIDEVDKYDGGSDRTLRRLEQLIEDRHVAGLTTLLAGNIRAASEAVRDVLGRAIESRINAGGAAINCAWGDVRGRLLTVPEDDE